MFHKSTIFKYDSQCGSYGYSYTIKLFANGTLVKLYYDFPKFGPEHINDDNQAFKIVVGPEIANRIKAIIKDNKGTLKTLPRELSNYQVMDGAFETLKLGRIKFTGWNMFTSDMESCLDYYKAHPIPNQDAFIYPLLKLQKIFNQIKEVFGDYWDNEIDDDIDEDLEE